VSNRDIETDSEPAKRLRKTQKRARTNQFELQYGGKREKL